MNDEIKIMLQLDCFAEKLEKRYDGKYSVRVGAAIINGKNHSDVLLYINYENRFTIDGNSFDVGDNRVSKFTPRSNLIEELQKFADRIEADRDRREVLLEKTNKELEEFVNNF